MALPTHWRFAKLVALEEAVSPAKFTLEADVCTIGRSPACQLVIPHQTISRLHARIERDDVGRYILYDGNSANGTFLNKSPQPLREPYMLKNRDVIGLGTPEPLLRFEDAEATVPLKITRLTYDEQTMTFFIDRKPASLTPSQMRLMQHLYNHAYDLCTRKSCAEALWEREYDPALDDQALDRMISNLRAQLRKVTPDADFITTRRGIGYILGLNPS